MKIPAAEASILDNPRGLASMAKSEHEAFYERTVAKEGPSLARLVRSYTRSNSDEEDLAQEVAIAIWQALKHFREQSSVRTYVFRVAHNQCINFLRKRSADPPSEIEMEEFKDPNPSAEHQIIDADHRRELREAITNLPISYRQVVVMALEDFSHKEIADVLGISENAVAIRLSRGKQLLLNKKQSNQQGCGI